MSGTAAALLANDPDLAMRLGLCHSVQECERSSTAERFARSHHIARALRGHVAAVLAAPTRELALRATLQLLRYSDGIPLPELLDGGLVVSLVDEHFDELFSFFLRVFHRLMEHSSIVPNRYGEEMHRLATVHLGEVSSSPILLGSTVDGYRWYDASLGVATTRLMFTDAGSRLIASGVGASHVVALAALASNCSSEATGASTACRAFSYSSRRAAPSAPASARMSMTAGASMCALAVGGVSAMVSEFEGYLACREATSADSGQTLSPLSRVAMASNRPTPIGSLNQGATLTRGGERYDRDVHEEYGMATGHVDETFLQVGGTGYAFATTIWIDTNGDGGFDQRGDTRVTFFDENGRAVSGTTVNSAGQVVGETACDANGNWQSESRYDPETGDIVGYEDASGRAEYVHNDDGTTTVTTYTDTDSGTIEVTTVVDEDGNQVGESVIETVDDSTPDPDDAPSDRCLTAWLGDDLDSALPGVVGGLDPWVMPNPTDPPPGGGADCFADLPSTPSVSECTATILCPSSSTVRDTCSCAGSSTVFDGAGVAPDRCLATNCGEGSACDPGTGGCTIGQSGGLGLGFPPPGGIRLPVRPTTSAPTRGRGGR